MERRWPTITPPTLPATLRLKTLILDEDLVVEGDVTTSPDGEGSSGSDGIPPSASPTPTVTGGPRWLAVKWLAQVNPDLVKYEVHVGTTPGFATSATTMALETPATLAFIRTVNGVPLAYESSPGVKQNYYVKLIAKDVDGNAPIGGEAGPSQLDPNVTDDYTVGSITAEKLEVVLTLTSSLLAGTANGARVELGFSQDGAGGVDASKIGIRSYAADGTTRTFEVDSLTGNVYIKGLIDWGTASHLFGNDIAEVARQPLPVGYQTPALIQQTSKSSTSASPNITWASPTQAGNLLVLAVYVVHPLVPPDAAPNISTPAGWTQRSDKQFIDGIEGTGNTSRLKVFSRLSTGDSGAQNYSFTGVGTFFSVAEMFEFSGVQDALDTNGTSINTVTGTSTLSGSVLPSSGSSTQDGLAFGAITAVNFGTNGPTITSTGGFTSTATLARDIFGTDAMTIMCQYKNIGTSATATPGGTANQNESSIIQGLLFKAKANTAVVDPPAVGSNAIRVYGKQAMWDEVKFASKPESGIEFYLDPLANISSRFIHISDMATQGGQAAGGTLSVLDSHLYADTTGANSAVGGNAGNASHPGIFDLSPGTTTTGRAEIKTRSGAMTPVTGDRIRMVYIVKTGPNLSDGTNRYRLHMGMIDDITSPGAAASNMATVWYSDSGVAAGGTNGAWNAQMANGAAIAADPLDDNGGSITVAINTWYRIEMEWIIGTGLSVWINGIKKVTNFNTNAPASGTNFFWYISILKALGTTNRLAYVDAMGIDFIFASSR